MEMMMAAQDQDQELNQIIRGKRTKRLRSPLALAITCSSSSGGTGDQIEVESSGFTDNNNTGEEEDMASCLILLAQGYHDHNRKSSPEIAAAATTTSDVKFRFGLDAFQCKTCDRCFSSFQALGGHRASHRKHKAEDKKVCAENKFNNKKMNMRTSLSLQTWKSNGKIHECSVCGAEFSSGQALGGHMRRHRTIVNGGGGSGPSTTLSLDSSSHEMESHESKKPNKTTSTYLQLDLNLPATAAEDIDRDDFRLASKKQVIVFSPSPLLDCHY